MVAIIYMRVKNAWVINWYIKDLIQLWFNTKFIFNRSFTYLANLNSFLPLLLNSSSSLSIICGSRPPLIVVHYPLWLETTSLTFELLEQFWTYCKNMYICIAQILVLNLRTAYVITTRVTAGLFRMTQGQ